MFDKKDLEEVETAAYNFAAVLLEKANKGIETVRKNVNEALDEVSDTLRNS